MKNLKLLRLNKGVDQKTVAESLGVTTATYSRYETGKRTPDPEMLDKLAKYYGVSVDYLLDRVVDVWPPPEGTEIPAVDPNTGGVKAFPNGRSLGINSYGTEFIKGPNWSQVIWPKGSAHATDRRPFRTYEVWSYTPCGIPNDLSDAVVDWEYVSEDIYKKGDIFLTVARGDSMKPEIRDGDTVICYYTENQAWDGAICCVRIAGETGTLKKIHIRPDGLDLIPLNPEYKTMFYTDKQVEEFPITIIGVLAEVRKKYHFYK